MSESKMVVGPIKSGHSVAIGHTDELIRRAHVAFGQALPRYVRMSLTEEGEFVEGSDSLNGPWRRSSASEPPRTT